MNTSFPIENPKNAQQSLDALAGQLNQIKPEALKGETLAIIDAIFKAATDPNRPYQAPNPQRTTSMISVGNKEFNTDIALLGVKGEANKVKLAVAKAFVKDLQETPFEEQFPILLDLRKEPVFSKNTPPEYQATLDKIAKQLTQHQEAHQAKLTWHMVHKEIAQETRAPDIAKTKQKADAANAKEKAEKEARNKIANERAKKIERNTLANERAQEIERNTRASLKKDPPAPPSSPSSSRSHSPTGPTDEQ